MFTYREFADGAHEYRQSILRRDRTQVEDDYELERNQNELAVINLSRTRDPEILASILTYMDSLIKSFDLYLPTSFEDCMKLSAILSYYKIIGRECRIAMTLMDKVYAKTRIDYRYSGGGLVFVMMPDNKHWEFLPYARAKIPITSSPGRIRTITHEYFVALVALNPLRRVIPSFSYAYAYWHCGYPMNAEGSLLSGLCDTDGTRPMLIYESNPDTITLFDTMKMQEPKPKLSSILSYLLQLMGALQLANDYANYTHYDLHSGNILVQKMDESSTITFQEYSITTNERIIIIDNGLAFCSYEKPQSLAPLRRAGGVRFPNANSVEIFTHNMEDVERLQSTTMRDYGSIQNRLVGVAHNRPYPLGDVFRIFFDIYSLCAPDMQEQLSPLVNHFFKDGDISKDLMRDTSNQASSFMNSFSLPPFREDLYDYEYRFFGQAILDNYPDIIGPFTEVNQRSMVIAPDYPGIKLDEVINWKVKNSDFFPNLYEIGLIYMLDSEAGRVLASKGIIVPSKEETLDTVPGYQRRISKMLNITTWYEIKQNASSLNIDVMLDDDFYRKFAGNVTRSVNCVQWARVSYSNFRAIYYALTAMNIADPLSVLSRLLNITPRDLSTFSNFCKTFTPSRQSQDVFTQTLALTQRVELVLSKIQIPRVITKENSLLNWYRACLPSIRIHLEFCVNWGGRSTIYGELAVPNITENRPPV